MISDSALIWSVGLALGTISIAPVMLRMRRRELATVVAEAKALEYGLHEPATLHPVVDPDICIGTGSCVDVCPEGDVFGFRNGQGVVVAPGACIGHGLCERSCPVEAVKLVYGTATRGVEIPRIRDDFQTNVDGLYIIGELGGMGLIRNAFEQGRQCIEGIAKRSRRTSDGLLHLVIVGAGPAGLAASLYARDAGLRFVTLERESDLGGTVRHYPRKKLVMTAPVAVPGLGKMGGREMLKEDLVELWQRLAVGLPIETGVTVKAVHKAGDGFALETSGYGYHARRVILAIGRRGVPRKLEVPGEELDNVQYALAEPEAFEGDRVLVVGGGDSAIEAALTISEVSGTTVRISYRRDAFGRIKPGNRARLDAALAGGAVEVLWSTNVARIEPHRVWLTGGRYGDAVAPIDNDQVLIFAGGELPTGFLRECGVDIDTKFGTS